MTDAKVFGIIALKGGVGKTTIVANLGAALAEEFNKKVLIVDANFSTPHLGLHVGLINPNYTLHRALNNGYPIHESIYQHPIGFHIIPGSLSHVPINPWQLKEKLEPLKKVYDIILIDSSPSLNDELVATMAASDELLVVSTPDYPTLSSTIHAVNVAKKKNTPIKGIILNKVRKKDFELEKKDIEDASEIDIIAIFPDDIRVLKSLSQMVPMVSYEPKKELSHLFKKLAGDLIGEEYSKHKVFKNLKKVFLKFKKKDDEVVTIRREEYA